MDGSLLAYLPELALLAGALVLFFTSLGHKSQDTARRAAQITAVAAIIACVVSFNAQATLFSGAYRVDAFSQILKLIFTCGLSLLLLTVDKLEDIQEEVRPEFFLFAVLSVFGLVTLVSSVDIITLVVALQMSAFPLYLMVPMRRESPGQRQQMESAAKYIMFGVAANGIMLFGLSYLFGMSGATGLEPMMKKLLPVAQSPLVIAGLGLTFCGLFYKLAVFPFHFWTPDVYQGSSNETAAVIASLPKIGAVAVLARFAALATPDNQVLAALLALLATASMFYGNLTALVQTDFKRLLGFSGIAHAGYTIVGLVALDGAGIAAALYYSIAYAFMVLACFMVACRVASNGANVSLDGLAGLHKRSPLLLVTLLVGIFGLAGVPPFAGFIGKLALLKAALAKGWLWLVIITVINSAIAIYYYLVVVREACFRDPGDQPPLQLDFATRLLCYFLIALIVALGVFPGRILSLLSAAVM